MLFTRKDIVKIVIPLIIEQLLAVTIGMFDSMMVSQAGEAAISGVSLVDSVNLLLINLFSALSSGGAVVVSQYLGKRDPQKASDSAKQLVLTVVIISTLTAVGAICFRVPLLKLIFGKIEADVMANARVYFLITAMSYPFLGLYSAGAATFRSMGNSKITMLVSMMMNVINVSGNAFFIFSLSMGAAGAALATLISRIVGSAVILSLLRNQKHIACIRGWTKTKPDWAIIKSICRIGVPSGIENSMFQFGKLITQSIVSTFGTTSIAANAVANTLTNLQFLPGTAINLAIITVVGRCIGARELQQAKSYSNRLLLTAYGAITSISVIIVALLPALLSIYDLSPASTELARQLVLMHSVMVCVFWPLSFCTPNTFRAAGDVKYTMVVSTLSMWICRVGAAYLYSYTLGLGAMGVWLAMFTDWVCRTCFFAPHYFKGTWLKNFRSV